MPSLEIRKSGDITIAKINVGWRFLWFRQFRRIKTALDVQSMFNSLPSRASVLVAFDFSAVRAVESEALQKFRERAREFRRGGSKIACFGLQGIEDPYTTAWLEKLFGKYENEGHALDALRRSKTAKELQNQFAAKAAAN